MLRLHLTFLFFLHVIALAFCNISSFAQVTAAPPPVRVDTIRSGDHTIVLRNIGFDTISTGSDQLIVAIQGPVFQTLDGDSIYTYLPQGPVSKDGPNWQDALFLWLRPEMARLDDGEYSLRIPDMVVGREGRIVYHSRPTLQKRGPGQGYQPVDSASYQELTRQAKAFLDDYEFLPALHEGRPAATVIHFHHTIFVKDHQAVMKQY